MKQFIFLIAITFSLSATQAQNKLNVHIAGGYTKFSQLLNSKPNDPATSTPKFGYLIGLEYQTLFTQKIGMGFGVNVNSTHSADEQNITTIDNLKQMKMDAKMTNLGIPIYLIVQPTTKLGINVGIRPAFNLSRSLHYEYYYTDRTEMYDYDWEGYQGFQFGMQAGIAYDITEHLSVEPLFYQELYNKGREVSSWQLMLGVKYALKK